MTIAVLLRTRLLSLKTGFMLETLVRASTRFNRFKEMVMKCAKGRSYKIQFGHPGEPESGDITLCSLLQQKSYIVLSMKAQLAQASQKVDRSMVEAHYNTGKEALQEYFDSEIAYFKQSMQDGVRSLQNMGKGHLNHERKQLPPPS